MKVKLLSDLHIEFKVKLRDQEYLKYDGADVLILAGDIHCGATNIIDTLKIFKDVGYPEIIYVPGNHEYYRGKSIAHFDTKVQEYCQTEDGIHFLNPGYVYIKDTLFIGAALWSNFHNDPWAEQAAARGITDFQVIPGFSTNECINLHEKHIAFITDSLKYRDVAKKTYVITHFLPCIEAVAAHRLTYGLELITKYFANNYTDLVSELENVTWAFGHSHDKIDRMVGNTRVVSNPIGYPSECNNFNPSVYI